MYMYIASFCDRQGASSMKMMFERFKEKAIKAVMMAQEESRRLGHNYVGTEMLLVGVVADADDNGSKDTTTATTTTTTTTTTTYNNDNTNNTNYQESSGASANVLRKVGVNLKDTRKFR